MAGGGCSNRLIAAMTNRTCGQRWVLPPVVLKLACGVCVAAVCNALNFALPAFAKPTDVCIGPRGGLQASSAHACTYVLRGYNSWSSCFRSQRCCRTQVSQDPAHSTDRASLAEQATQRWIDDLVVGEKLCPWAPRAETRVVSVSSGSQDMRAHLRFVLREALQLVRAAAAVRQRSSSALVAATTVIVFNNEMYDGDQGLPAFVALWRGAEKTLAAARCSLGDGGMDLLAFHPRREDRGPGCSNGSADDACHYGVRAPFPALQLLCAIDLEAARSEWASRHGGRGAFGLLLGNKLKLQDLGAAELEVRLAGYRRKR